VNNLLFKHIDNTGLVLFRAVFGLLITMEAFGALATGWVRRSLVEPEFTFNFIGFDFLQHLTGSTMYFYFALMGLFGLMVMLGYKYRWSMIAYALMWTAVYLMQKSAYNNHYYLMMLLCWIMAFLPANRSFSLDAKFNPKLKSDAMPRWCLLVLILQVWLVYTFAAVAKLYPDWLDGTAVAMFMNGKKNYWLIGSFLQLKWVHYCIAYVGIFFDLLIVPLLLWKRTRLMGFMISVIFHLFNSIVFQIGIFPYMSIAFAFFFFSPETLQKRFLPRKNIYSANEIIEPKHKNILIGIFSIYFLVQLSLPLRHWFFKDDVLWTEEGHRLSWRMMLRSKQGSVKIWVVDKACGERSRYDYNELLSNKQRSAFKTKPDLLWQLAKRIKKVEAEKGIDVAVYFDSKVSVNGGVYHPFIDPMVDLASQEWKPFTHHSWILPSPENYRVF
jgi:vitamin K-dependent gamma-carboxylase